LLSAAHVFGLHEFSLLDDFYVRDTDGNIYKVGNINKYSTVSDMVVFELERYPDHYSALSFSDEVEIGDTVFSVGNAQGEGISYRAGQVASFTFEEEFGKWKNIRFTSPASPGNSGGPLVDIEGDVVGLIVKKNPSENHNVAIPVNQIAYLPRHAEFHLRNLSVYLNDEQNNITKDWKEVVDLPDSIKNVSAIVQESLNNFYVGLSVALGEKFKDEYFPRGKRFRAYLRNQQYVRQFGVLKADLDFKEWNLNYYDSSTVPVHSEQNITVAKSDISSLHLTVEKPPGMMLSEFIGSPGEVMDNMLNGILLTRSVGDEKIRVTSLGLPEKVDAWEDKAGRKWMSSLWYLPYIDAFLYSHCLPYPKGAICNIDIKNNDELNKGYLDFVRVDYNEIAIGYVGEIYDWIEYLKLDEKYKPGVFRKMKIDINNNELAVNLDEYSLRYKYDSPASNSTIHMHFGYSNESLLAEDLLLFELFPKKGVESHLRVQKYYSPSIYSSDAYKASWEDMSNQTGKFSGEVVSTTNLFSVRNVMEDTRRKIVSQGQTEIESIYVVGCMHDTLREDIKPECDRFSENVAFRTH